MPNDQVRIKFGPARYDSPKAVRRQIEDAKAETEEVTINKLVNDPDIDLGGGGSTGTVLTYDPVTGEGTYIDGNGDVHEFTNGTGVFLVPGDVIVTVEDGNGNEVVVGVTDRSGQVTPVDQPIAVIDPSFPIDTNSLTFRIRVDYNGSAANRGTVAALPRMAYDLAGELGFGADLIIGGNGDLVTFNDTTTSINAFSRDTSTSYSLYPPQGASLSIISEQALYVQPGSGGRLVSIQGTSLYYRNPADTSWSSFTTMTTGNWAIDRDTGYIWGCTQSTTTTAPTVYRFAPTDAAPTSMGAMGLPTSSATSAPRLAAGKGYLTMTYLSTSTTTRTYAVKASADNTNFSAVATFAVASWDLPTTTQSVGHLQVNASGATSYLLTTSGTIRIRELAQTGVITDHDTGIPASTTRGANHLYLSSGLVLIACVMLTSDLGDPNAGRYTPVLATYNYATTSYQYYDITQYDTTVSTDLALGAPVEVQAGKVRWTFGPGSASTNLVFTLTELSGL